MSEETKTLCKMLSKTETEFEEGGVTESGVVVRVIDEEADRLLNNGK